MTEGYLRSLYTAIDEYILHSNLGERKLLQARHAEFSAVCLGELQTRMNLIANFQNQLQTELASGYVASQVMVDTS